MSVQRNVSFDKKKKSAFSALRGEKVKNFKNNLSRRRRISSVGRLGI